MALYSSWVDTLFLLLPAPLPLGRVMALLMLPDQEAWRISGEALFTRVREGEFSELRRYGVLRSSHLALMGGIILPGLTTLSCLERGGRYLCPTTSKTRRGWSRLLP